MKDHLVYFASAKNTPVPRICESIHYSTATYCSVRSPFVMQIGVRHKYFILLCLYSDNGSAKYYAMLPGLCWLFCFCLCMRMQARVCVWRPCDYQVCIGSETRESEVHLTAVLMVVTGHRTCRLYSISQHFFVSMLQYSSLKPSANINICHAAPDYNHFQFMGS